MYPLTLIRVSKGKVIQVELKNNEIYEGILSGCDLLMNMCLRNVTVTKTYADTSANESDKDVYFLNECYVKGSLVKLVKLSDNVLEIQKNLERKRKREKKPVKKHMS